MKRGLKIAVFAAALLFTGTDMRGVRNALRSLETPAKAQAAAPAGPSFATFINICRASFAIQMRGGDGQGAARQMLATLPEDARPAALFVCASYEQGQRDLLAAIQAGSPKSTSV